MVLWEEEFVLFLIEKVRNENHVWNRENPSYKNKLKKQQFWLQLTEELNMKFNPKTPFTYDDVIKKWNNLRSYFTVENQKLAKEQKSCVDVDEVENIQSSWKYKSRLDFLLTTFSSVNNFNKRNLKNFLSEDKLLPNSSNLSSESSSSATNEKRSANKIGKYNERSDTSTPISAPSISHFMDSDDEILKAITRDTAGASHRFSDPTETPPDETFTPTHIKKEPMNHNESLASAPIGASKGLTEVRAQHFVQNFAFGACIAAELDKLAPDLQIAGKKHIFNTIMDLQAEQIKRAEN